MLELLQRKDEGNIIITNSGTFYIARGRDAVLLHNMLNLKVNCMETEVCKVGFPLNALEKYTKLIEQKNYSYIVYNYDSKLSKLSILKKYKGKYLNTIKEDKLNCYICSNTVKMYKKHDKYIQAVADLYEQENKENAESNHNIKSNKKVIRWIKKRKKQISYS